MDEARSAVGNHFRRVCENLLHFVPTLRIPISRIVILLVRQKGSDVDVPLGLFSLPPHPCIMNYGDKPVSILPEVEYDIAIDMICILE